MHANVHLGFKKRGPSSTIEKKENKNKKNVISSVISKGAKIKGKTSQCPMLYF